LLASSIRRIGLGDGQWLTGEFLSLEADDLRLRTAWAERLTIPRRGVTVLTHLPGFIPIVEEDFETDLKRWKVTGKAARNSRQHASGRQSLHLGSADDSVEMACADPLTRGRVVLDFRDEPSKDSGGSWVIEAVFRSPQGPHFIRVLIPALGAYRVEAAGLPGDAAQVQRQPGWHTLDLEFGPDAVMLTMDKFVLWSNHQQGPGGPLEKVRLGAAAHADLSPPGEIFFDNFCLARSVDERPHPPSARGQDMLWLADGDELFGTILQADRRAIHFRGRYGRRSLPWSTIRGLFFERQSLPPRATQGEHVRISIRSGLTAEDDQLDVIVVALNDHQLTFDHALMGRHNIERARISRFRWLFSGQRIEVDNGIHLLGTDKAGGFATLPARELRLRKKFRLDAIPIEANLVVRAANLSGPGDGADVAQALQDGGLRTDVIINGQSVDYLNRHVTKATREPRSIRLKVPRNLLRTGENELELRQTPDPETGRYGTCTVHGLTVEVPGPIR
jgi:hypothetical protein